MRAADDTDLAGYRIETEVGRGGMGVVYRAAATALAVSGGSVWVLNSREEAGTISRIDAAARLVVTTFFAPSTPVDRVGLVWVAGLLRRA